MAEVGVEVVEETVGVEAVPEAEEVATVERVEVATNRPEDREAPEDEAEAMGEPEEVVSSRQLGRAAGVVE